MIVLTVAFLGCSYQIYLFTKFYFEYPVFVNLQIKERNKVRFPAVTICNLNRMKSKYEKHHSFDGNQIESPLDITGVNSDQMPLPLSEKSDINFRNKNESQEHLKFLRKYYNLNSESRQKFGYQLEEVVKSCLFNFKPCEFKKNLNMRYGNCFTFNQLNGIFQEVPMASFAGPNNGLEMILIIDPDQYLAISHTVGMRIVIHDPSDEPNPEDKGIAIAPGYETYISLKETLMQRLPAPYKDKCVFYGGDENPLVESQAHCMQVCIQEYNFARCGCVEPFFGTTLENKKCDTTNSIENDCLDSLMKDLAINGSTCKCPPPCLSKYYNERITRVLWPSKAYFLEMNRTENFEFAWDFYRKSHARVRIIFSKLERTEYEQNARFQESEIFSCLGGELALWLGISFFVLCELIEVPLFLVSHFICYLKESINLFNTKYALSSVVFQRNIWR
ncbi:Degenerin mec-10 [Araneus ventricosus]|uniref:Degenerin mec-10 n=1 Tax=Araneus ventricosus TaxID=182803 RepID=A0A4Y2LQI9_ARAVE|nr:Degenerin mec-10 [Araneus ventricosus]